MAQVEIHLSRNDQTPWGFRLTGGSDFEIPLQVIKVTKDSIADKADLRVADIILCINNIPAVDLTHLQAHDVILEAGNDFTISVIRENHPEIPIDTSEITQQSTQICVESMESEVTKEIQEISEKIQTEIQREVQQMSGHLETEIQLSVQITEEQIRTEEEVNEDKTTEIISNESEIKEQKEAVEVNFSKIMPGVEFIKESEVLKVLNEEELEETKEKMVKEKKWSTFLQKPSRPKPKDKKREAEKPKDPPYRVVIVKGKKKQEETPGSDAATSQGSTPVPSGESIELTTPDSQTAITTNEPYNIQYDQQEQTTEDAEKEQEDNTIEDEMTTSEPVNEVNEVEMSLEEQLAAVQKQLLALSQLPAAIQQTLDVVTNQLAKIVGDTNPMNDDAEQGDECEDKTENDDTENQEDDYERELDILDEIPEEGESDEENREHNSDEEIEDGRESRNDEERENVPEEKTPEPEEELTEEEKEARRIAKEKEDKRIKDKQILEELHQRRLKERPTFPLTPLQRPIFLPGGRRWKMPDDANPNPELRFPNMTDDKIAETISAQSEIITGTTLGDSNCEFVPSRAIATKKINFLKYQPVPVPLDHLKHSEVFKLVHDLEPAPRGIPARSGKAHAEEDYYNQARSEAPQHAK